ncbi:MAG: tRNA (uridine(34)/cytosine(34)/5-carboxymethylaminomethyluridine(34)-2'-O)-methyltransferase TrmL [Halobacteriovoraceae bacterium]|nr:tRNA (uridine(34)/cytosine(34)/5-carboxymethylaminomethyluridine(34)-2'-O)-methyltransferase TrmL [Halobacteriovoraceae bacterium]|tara:strand:+ start:9902 stop:10381 length:480 start_codon:yes stop_codon:yes gene_type:complete
MVNKKPFNIVLVAPEIPGNTGSIGRTCVALGLRLILIHPFGFDLSEKAVRRAGLDYWKFVDLKEYHSFEEFLEHEAPLRSQLYFFENHQEQHIYQAEFSENSYLIFGSETKGLAQEIYQDYKDRMYALPMFSENIRSLNLSNAATTVAYECLRQLNLPK